MPKKPPPPKPPPTLGELVHRLRNRAPYFSDPAMRDLIDTIASIIEHLPGVAKAGDDHKAALDKAAAEAQEEDE